MIEAKGFGAQNWLITPAASAGNAPPPPIQRQKWLMVLSGVVFVDLKGINVNDWTRETLLVRPELTPPLQHAIATHQIPTPPPGVSFAAFQVDSLVAFGGLSSIRDGHSGRSGYAVDTWRPIPFGKEKDSLSTAMLTRLFEGIQFDLAVLDKGPILHRVSYHVTLLGNIVFPRVLTS